MFEMTIIRGLPFEAKETSEHVSSVGSFMILPADAVIDLVNAAIVGKVYFIAVIVEINWLNMSFKVTSAEVNTINSFRFIYQGDVLDKNYEPMKKTDIKAGDRVELYYYQRYKTYTPVDIYVGEVVLIDKMK